VMAKAHIAFGKVSKKINQVLLIFIHNDEWTYMLIFRHIFLSNYWWQKSDIWSQASYRYLISWEAFLDPSDSYFLFADFVDFYTHLAYICICTFLLCIKINKVGKQEVGISLWWVQKRFPRYGVPIWSLWPNIKFLLSIVAEKNVTKNEHICSLCITYRGKRFWTRQIPTSCLPILLIFIHI
jgi:hypothetical protein